MASCERMQAPSVEARNNEPGTEQHLKKSHSSIDALRQDFDPDTFCKVPPDSWQHAGGCDHFPSPASNVDKVMRLAVGERVMRLHGDVPAAAGVPREVVVRKRGCQHSLQNIDSVFAVGCAAAPLYHAV
jgi:hypothetical protein